VATSPTLSQALGPKSYFAWSTSDVFVGYTQLHHELDRTSMTANEEYVFGAISRALGNCHLIPAVLRIDY